MVDANVGLVPKARIAKVDINGRYLEAGVQLSQVKGSEVPKASTS